MQIKTVLLYAKEKKLQQWQCIKRLQIIGDVKTAKREETIFQVFRISFAPSLSLFFFPFFGRKSIKKRYFLRIPKKKKLTICLQENIEQNLITDIRWSENEDGSWSENGDAEVQRGE